MARRNEASGFPEFVRGWICMARDGSMHRGYEDVGWLFANLLERFRPASLSRTCWRALIRELDKVDDASALHWFFHRYPKLMALLPDKSHTKFLAGFRERRSLNRRARRGTRLCVAFALICNLAIAAGPVDTWRVVGVHDGDTITCLTKENHQVRVRLNAVDAPELGQPFGNRSKQTLSELVFGKQVQVEDLGPDKYKRTIGRVTVDNKDVNHEMVAAGMAWHYVKYDQSKELSRAESAARAAKTGLWSDPHAVPPWDWRKMDKASRDTIRSPSTSSRK